MNLNDYLVKHDGKPKPHGAELVRLANACGKNPYYIYLTALGHKRVGPETAKCLHENSINRELEAARVNKQKKPAKG